MYPHKSNKNHNSTFQRTLRYIGLSFAGFAFALIIVCATSLRIARQVQKKYDFEVLQAINKLKLINTLNHNEDKGHNLLLSYMGTADPKRRSALREEVKQGYKESALAAKELDQLMTNKFRKEQLQDIMIEHTAYYAFADSLMHLSDLNRLEDAKAFAEAYLEPAYQRQERQLNRLSSQIQAETDARIKAAASGISTSVDTQTVLLFLAMASAAGAFFILRRIFRRLREENAYQNEEIQGRIQLEMELSESKQEYMMLFNSNPVPMWIYDEGTYRFLQVNKAAEIEYGYTQEEFMLMSLFDIRPQEDKQKLLHWIEKERKDAETASNDFRHKRRDGTVFKVELKSHALPRKHGTRPRLVVAVNVQDRELAIEQLKKNEKLLREVSSSLPGAVYQYQMESDGRFSFPYISEGIWELCGVTPEEVYRDPSLLFKNLPTPTSAEVQRSIEESYRNVTPWELELRMWHYKQERYIWVRGHSLPSIKGNGTVQWNGTLIDITKQKEAQERLRHEEAKLKGLLDSSMQAVFLLDKDLKVISFNKEAATDVRRYLLRELKVGQSMENFVAPVEVPTLKEHHATAMRGETVTYETRQGEYWHEITYLPVICPEGSILGVALNIRNISEQKLSFETIKRNELQLARAQQLAKLGGWEYHIKQNVLTWSEGTYAIFGLRKDKFTPSLHNMELRVHPEDRMRVRAERQAAIVNKRLLNVEHRILRPDGTVADVLEVAEVICDESGEAEKLYGTVQDITERKKAEQEITEAKNLLQTTLENIPEIIFTANPDFTIIYISPQCEQITGYPEEAFLGDSATWLKSIHSEDKKPLMLQVLPKVLAGKQQEYEMRLQDSNGKLRWLLLRMSPALDAAGKVTRIYGSASDMTAYKEAEARQQELSRQLLRQNQNLQQFAYIVSHNLRAPIANMLGLTSIYNRNEIDSPLNQKVIDNMMKSAQLLDTTIRDLNDLLTIRSQIGNMYETISFGCLLQDVLELLKADINACEAAIIHDFSGAPTVSAIRSYAQSILLNLLSNAIKYRCPGRNLEIRVTTFKHNDYICLRVQDNGLGIDLVKQQENIFGLYKRFHKGIEGKGIGLHLVKTQVEMLEGKVEVESKPQEGTIFNVYFKH